MPIKAVLRDMSSVAELAREGITWFEADLLKARSLDGVLAYGDVVCNLAYLPDAGETTNVTMIDNIIESCLRSRVARLVHCSTAVVVGAARASRIFESTTCVPLTCYEKTKWALEQRVLSALPRGIDVGILRPTAIVGPGGQNLLKLSTSLRNGNTVTNYLRASIFARRSMHLVPVRNVTAALFHVTGMPIALNGNIYHVSSDNDPNNNFKSIEEVLLRSLGLHARKLPLLPMPAGVLSLLLGLMGRSDTDTARIYDPGKLLDTGFKPVDSVVNAVREFGEKTRNFPAGIGESVRNNFANHSQ